MIKAVPEPFLFCGVPLSPDLSQHLKKVSSDKANLYISEGPSGLKKVKVGDSCYLGKEAGTQLTDEEMALLERNIVSILQKLIPEYSMIDGQTVIIGCSESPYV